MYSPAALALERSSWNVSKEELFPGISSLRSSCDKIWSEQSEHLCEYLFRVLLTIFLFNACNRDVQGSIILLQAEQAGQRQFFKQGSKSAGRGRRMVKPSKGRAKGSWTKLVVVVLVSVQKMTFDSCYVFLEKIFFCSKSSWKYGPKVFGKRSVNQFVSV